MKKHPSGRKVEALDKRDYSMMAHRRIGFVCPRLNEALPPRHDTYAVGFASGFPEREDLYLYTEAKK